MIAYFVSANLPLVAQSQGPAGLLGSPLLMMVVIMAIFYVLLILPQQRRQKKHRQLLAALKSGDKVITNGGIFGTIVGLEDGAVQLRVADQVRIKVLRSAIADVQPETKES